MNIIEAIKSGRSFRRPCFPVEKWYQYSGSIMYRSDGSDYLPDKEDILADDWETQEIAITITASQFWNAYRDAVVSTGPNWTHVKDLMSELARRLGLESK